MQLLRVKSVAQSTGLSVSSIYKQVRLGFFPRGVKLTARAIGWPENEILKINEGRIAGLSEAEMIELVQGLVAARQNVGGAV